MEIKKELEQHKQAFYRAFHGVSFSPEKRAETTIKEHSEQLESDLAELGENSGNYKEKYISKLLDCMHAKSRCMSAMITGPANFPVARNQRAFESESNKWEQFYNWRKKYFKAVNRVKTPSPEEELDNALKSLDCEIESQILMKAINKIIKRKTLAKEEKIALIIEESGYKEETILNLFNAGWWGDGFAPFQLTSINNKIKRLKEKVLTMKARIKTKTTFEPINFENGSINIEADRVVIYHDEKPNSETISNLKKHGFRWSRKFSCWCRKHTAKALYDAKNICGIKSELKREEKQTRQDKINSFPFIFFVFNDEQFKKGMDKLGLKHDDYKLLLSIGAGGYILKSKRAEFKELLK